MTVAEQAPTTGSATWERWTNSPDMHDTWDEVQVYRAQEGTRPLARALEICHEVIERPFGEADVTAQRRQTRYRRNAALVAYSGSLAVILAIVHIAIGEVFGADSHAVELWKERVLVLEVIAAGFAAVAVGYGLYAYHQEDWRLQRFKAEQLRLLKFSALIEPSVLQTSEVGWDTWRRALVERVEEIGTYDRHAIAHAAEAETVPRAPDPKQLMHLNREAVVALVGYYDRKRLSVQRRYFAKRALAHPHNPRLGIFLFVGSIIAVAVHLAFEWMGALRASAAFVAVSAILPAMYAGLRTHHASTESSRSISRSAARHSALCQVDDELRKATESSSAKRNDFQVIFWNFKLSEFILDTDQREWLRLMREAEWIA
ncbi:MAG TPA: hypothetical protein VJ803_12010 [Gemmatimonadaceae bacterium]|nr:hypothetical protein [Gemmatimonadaceae bacterium]